MQRTDLHGPGETSISSRPCDTRTASSWREAHLSICMSFLHDGRASVLDLKTQTVGEGAGAGAGPPWDRVAQGMGRALPFFSVAENKEKKE